MKMHHSIPTHFEWISNPWLLLSASGEYITSNQAMSALGDSTLSAVIAELQLVLSNSSLKKNGHKTTTLSVSGRRFKVDILKQDEDQQFFCLLQNWVKTDDKPDLYSSVFEQSGEAIMITDADDDIIDVNRAFELKTGFKLANIRYKKPAFLRSGLNEEQTLENAWFDVKAKGHWSGEIKNRKANGEYYISWLSLSAIKDDSGKVTHYISIFSDITQHIQEHKKFKQLAYHDFLTGLPNRALLEDRFEQFVLHSDRLGQTNKCALIFIDINSLKLINDTYGHQKGDDCLVAIANVLKNSIRADDTASRFSGDEFVLLLTQIDGDPDLLRVIEQVNRGISAIHQSLRLETPITASLGTAIYPDDALDLDALLQNADAKMYEQKNSSNIMS
ncbi:diguanylate cyclase [Alishewanella sp. WH16-1]|jgi:diguanylate cyclase (GGDEF)-like protein/PAS domain S-box-containing protein|uniref:GGDEF domain-containing protein n=1 Tax=Gammaproteobacteria TaxID=1236 RepID=UPI000710F04D|nr:MULTISPECIES: GGDEF domain-containing protein [Gammaproteobacteria]KRS21590.1 diguanylate cyclase [Alishewanella sp. WH16-1]QBL10732.1 diguanylate cyclase [Rheinheimera sp. D18]